MIAYTFLFPFVVSKSKYFDLTRRVLKVSRNKRKFRTRHGIVLRWKSNFGVTARDMIVCHHYFLTLPLCPCQTFQHLLLLQGMVVNNWVKRSQSHSSRIHIKYHKSLTNANFFWLTNINKVFWLKFSHVVRLKRSRRSD